MSRIFLTGGSGWLSRAIMRFWTENEYTVFSRSEYLQAVCREKYPAARYVLGDICDQDSVTRAMSGCDIVIHCAGMKRVTECEQNVAEAIAVNVDGSRSVGRAAERCGVDVAVAISTDKAVNPVGVYGMTKALMERYWMEMAARGLGGTDYVVVRNGNFVGSTGSVIPTWQAALDRGERIQLTDPDMTRFWQGAKATVALIREAVRTPGKQLLIYPGLPCAMRMGDLAALIAGDSVDVVGARPGERRHEQMVIGGELSCNVRQLSPEEMTALIEEAALV